MAVYAYFIGCQAPIAGFKETELNIFNKSVKSEGQETGHQ